MNFISCQAPQGSTAAQRARTWLYVAECRVAVGDVIVAPFGYGEGEVYMTVTAVGKTRHAVGSDYTGAVKVITRVADAVTEGRAAEIARLVKLADLEDNLQRSEAEGSTLASRYTRARAIVRVAMLDRGEQV